MAAEWWVAEEEDSGRLVGFARSIERDGLLELTELFVLPNQQSRGSATRGVEPGPRRFQPHQPLGGGLNCLLPVVGAPHLPGDAAAGREPPVDSEAAQAVNLLPWTVARQSAEDAEAPHVRPRQPGSAPASPPCSDLIGVPGLTQMSQSHFSRSPAGPGESGGQVALAGAADLGSAQMAADPAGLHEESCAHGDRKAITLHTRTMRALSVTGRVAGAGPANTATAAATSQTTPNTTPTMSRPVRAAGSEAKNDQISLWMLK
jgi:hypothetical protein